MDTNLVFTGILAVAVLLQGIIFFGIYRAIRQMSVRIDGIGKDLLSDVKAIASKVDEGLVTIKEMAEGFKPIKENLTSATDIIHKRVVNLDSFLAETTDTARLEVMRIRDRIETASNRTEEILNMLHDSVLIPVNEFNAIARGIKAGMDVLFRRRRNPSTANPQDEEMFI